MSNKNKQTEEKDWELYLFKLVRKEIFKKKVFV